MQVNWLCFESTALILIIVDIGLFLTFAKYVMKHAQFSKRYANDWSLDLIGPSRYGEPIEELGWGDYRMVLAVESIQGLSC